MEHFTLSLAGLTFSVACQYESTRRLCRDYLTQEASNVACSFVITPQDLEREQQILRCKAAPGADNLEIVESYVLCRCLAEALPAHCRVLFHGSALSLDGRGVLFTAKSGTGKSTHTRLWRQVFGDRVTMVNDDKPFLHITPQGVAVCGSPWQGKHNLGENISVPLDAICILCRGQRNTVEPVSPREALPVLLQQTFSPEDPGNLRRTLALVEQLSRTVPVYRLYCNMDPEAALVACRGIGLNDKKVGAL